MPTEETKTSVQAEEAATKASAQASPVAQASGGTIREARLLEREVQVPAPLERLRPEDTARIASLSNIPAANPDEPFIGREETLETIHTRLHEGVQAIVHRQQTIAGLGGVGKTSLARHYARQQQGHYAFIRELSAETNGLDSSFRGFAYDLGIDPTLECYRRTEDLVAAVYRTLKDIPHWLLIFDNVRDYQAIAAYLPRDCATTQHILVTSRDQHWEATGTIALDVFTALEARRYILTRLPDSSEADANALAEQLGRLPLALSHATAYIRQSQGRMQIPDYLAEITQHDIGILQDAVAGEEGLNPTVIVTWLISMQAILTALPEAAQLFAYLAYLASNRIPYFLLQPLMQDDRSLLEASLEQLKAFSLIQDHPDTQDLDVHQLVQAVTRLLDKAFTGLPIEAQLQTVLTQKLPQWPRAFAEDAPQSVLRARLVPLMQEADKLMPTDPTLQQFVAIRVMTAHAQTFLGHQQGLPDSVPVSDDEIVTIANFMGALAGAYVNIGDQQKARPISDTAFDWVQRYFQQTY